MKHNAGLFTGYDFYGRMAAWLSPGRIHPGKTPVLLYHSVGGDPTVRHAELFNVTPALLSTHLGWLKDNGFATITPDEWLKWATEGQPLPARRVLLAFDDGYRNNVEQALPLLRQYGMRAVFFIASAYVNQPASFPWIAGPGSESYRPMTADDIRALDLQGMTIGAHTRTHRRLNTLPDSEALAEIRESKVELETILGKAVNFFAYPYGSKWDIHARHQTLCEQAGLKMAFTTDPGSSTRHSSRFAVPRITVYQRDKLNIFKLKATGRFDGYNLFRKIIRTPIRLLCPTRT